MNIKPINEVIPDQLIITARALRKALTYARLVVQEFGDVECIGYLLADRDRGDDVVDDVLLAPDQEATASSVKLEGSAVLSAGRKIEAMGKRAVGWWHSHNSMATFHSSIDDENTAEPISINLPSNSALASAVIAALLVEEVRRFLLPLPDDCPLPPNQVLHYNPSHPHRFAPSNEGCSISQFPNFPISHVLLIGAGALGTFAALALATRGDIDSLTIIDPDYVEATNLNRQPLFLRAVGDGKAVTLAKQLRKIQPAMQVDSIAEPVSPEHFDRCRPDLVLSCVDSFAPRKLIHDECLRRGIPLINGGTSAFSGHIEVYVPNKTACFNCLYALDSLAAREAAARSDPARCQRAVEASIVTTNALIGALMAAEVGYLHEPLRRMIRYDARLPHRFRLGYARPPCACRAKDETKTCHRIL